MLVVAEVAAAIAAVIHVLFFVMESVLFTRPRVWRRFGVASQQDADTIRLMALNQGFYNLFLAVGAVVGVVALALGHRTAGTALVAFAVACMAGAGAVLVVTGGAAFVRAAAVQALFPVVALIALAAA